MTIGVVTTSYPRFAGDPAGNFVGAHVAALRALGHHVDVIAAGESSASAEHARESSASAEHARESSASAEHAGASDFGVTRIASSLFYRGGAPDELERSPRSMFAAAVFTARLAVAVRRSPRWDLIVAHWLAPCALAALPTRAPLLAIAHGGDVHLLRRTRLLAPALYALRARDARLAFVSNHLLDLARAAAPGLARWLATAAIVQPMGVARFAAVPRKPIHPPTILVAARLVPIKGVDVALDALAHIRAPAELVIAGDGPERELLVARTPRARFLGEVDAATRDRLLAEAAVVVVPSRVLPNGRTEGMPMIALEALAAGVPVVASAVGGLRELAPHAELVPPDDPRALAAAIDRALAAGPNRTALASMDWQTVATRLLAHAGV